MVRKTSLALAALIGIAVVSLTTAPRIAAQDAWPTADSWTNAAGDAANWILPARSYSGNRYVKTTQITPRNVGTLKKMWSASIDARGPLETSPIVWNGVMYVTSSHNDVYALDAATGAQKWHFHDNPHVIAFSANRGVALANGKVYEATLDGHLIALDATTGKPVWNVVAAHDTTNTFYTMQPVPYKNMLLLGASNGDWGGIGYISAFDQATGKRLWDWYTVPGPGQPGHSSWSGDSWKRGGGAIWSGVAIDPATNMLYVDAGNPQPDFLGTIRKGANLYTNSTIALDISGAKPKMKWYHQYIPHDTHDWDPAMPPVLFTGTVGGASRKLVAAGDKGGNFWVLDAGTGALVYHVAVSTQKGQNTEPSRTGNIACPNTNGGVEFNGASYLKETNAFYIPSVDQCGRWKSPGTATYIAGQFYLGGSFPTLVGPSTGYMQALDIGTGKFLWRKHLAFPQIGGALSMSSGVVFSGGVNGDFAAYDAKTGNVLWHWASGMAIQAPAMTYEAGGKQYVAVAVGPAGVNFADPRMGQGAPTLEGRYTHPTHAAITAFALP
ncbi:MAG TPA: PQQ-binding-like beta-propeller repeat protein [Candidatus Baltobacteraceae bacterium]|nr:PQQ-binding-like beta-propeller repeat protein [Candidatus Baltobacteraceae bacterium]